MYGDGITSFTNEDDDDMLVEKECIQSSCDMEDEIDSQACLSWG